MQYGYGISFGLLGFFVCGFIQHEGSHNALSNYQWINRIGAWLVCPWGHPDVWMYKHVIEHHPNTNTRMDEDIQFEGPILRHHYMSKLSFFHRFQAWSITILSMFVSISHPMNFDLFPGRDHRGGERDRCEAGGRKQPLHVRPRRRADVRGQPALLRQPKERQVLRGDG